MKMGVWARRVSRGRSDTHHFGVDALGADHAFDLRSVDRIHDQHQADTELGQIFRGDDLAARSPARTGRASGD